MKNNYEDRKYVMDTYSRNPINLVKGEGIKVYDNEGKEYLDFVAGIAVNCLGYSHPKIVSTIINQSKQLMHCSNLYWNENQINLAKILCEKSFGESVFFCNSGAEANEGALKLARKYAYLKYGEKKFEVISAYKSFHGRTYGSLTATGQNKYHKYFKPLVGGFRYVVYNDIDNLKKAINNETCAILLEVIQGEGGINEADEAYLKEVRKLCDEYDILLIFDEVQTGIGRTGKLFAYEHFGVKPDIMTLAKGLGGGIPIGAVVANEKANVFLPGDHASTFGGNPLACAVGMTVMNIVSEDSFLENVQNLGNYFKSELLKLKEKYICIKNVRGKGLMIGCELNDDNGYEIVKSALNKGLLINAVSNNILRFVPPLIVSKEDILKAIDILDTIFQEMDYKSTI